MTGSLRDASVGEGEEDKVGVLMHTQKALITQNRKNLRAGGGGVPVRGSVTGRKNLRKDLQKNPMTKPEVLLPFISSSPLTAFLSLTRTC